MADQVEQDCAEFNLHTNTLIFYFSYRSEEEYLRLKELFCTRLGMSYGRGRKCFYGRWEPPREDAILQYVAEIPTIIDDDAGYTYRLERFGGYAEDASDRSVQHHATAEELGAIIPLGQPILLGHHSERSHRRRLEKIRQHATAALAEYYKSEKWKSRLAAAIANKQQKEDPGTIKRRIAKHKKELSEYQILLSQVGQDEWRRNNHQDSPEGYETAAENARRWVAHLEMVIQYQEKLYIESEMLPSDRGELVLEKGGAVNQFAWWQNKHCWLPIVSINKTSVTYLTAHALTHPITDTVKLDAISEALSKDDYQAHPDWEAHGRQLWEAYHHKPARPDGMEKGAGLKYKKDMAQSRWNGPFPIERVGQKSITILHRFERHSVLQPRPIDRQSHILEVVPKAEFQPWWAEQELLISLEQHYLRQGWDQSGRVELSLPEQVHIAERLASQGLVEQLGQGLFRLPALTRRDLIQEHHLTIGSSDDDHLWGRWIEKKPEAKDAIRSELSTVETGGPYPMRRSLIHERDNRHMHGVEVSEFGRLCRPSQVYIIDPSVYQIYLELLPPKVQALNWFIFAEGDDPILFWQEEEKVHYAYRSYTYKRLGGYVGLNLSSYDLPKKNVDNRQAG